MRPTAGYRPLDILQDVLVILYKEVTTYRRVGLFLVPILAYPLGLVVLQIGLVIILAFGEMQASVLAAQLAARLPQSATTVLGAFVILATAAGLATFTMARDRQSGCLEGLLATPLTTAGLWIGKTLALWIPGMLLYHVCLVLILVVGLVMPGHLPGLELAALPALAGQSGLLLVTSLVFIALLTLVQLGGNRVIAVLGSVLFFVGLMATIPLVVSRLMKGGLPQSTLFVRLELVALPVLIVLVAGLCRTLLERERILMRFQ